MPKVRVSYYSDVLCIWAYAAQRRLQQMVEEFGDQISIETRYCSVFPDAFGKIEQTWKTKGGFEGFNLHLIAVAKQFPHLDISQEVWRSVRPRTSASAHQFLKAVELVEADLADGQNPTGPYFEQISVRAAWSLRLAFFRDGKDIADRGVHEETAASLGLDFGIIKARIRSSEALTRLLIDYDHSRRIGVEGSPTFVMNEGRQKLFGNVGYRVLKANIQELLHNPSDQEASWC
ncbi:MAG: DsbA family protein [Paracoccaceae bacterium]